MTIDPFQPLKVGKQILSWRICSGRAKSLRRYTETHTIPGAGQSPDMPYTQQVTEFWIKDAAGKETPVALPWDLMLAEGQRVSAVDGYVEGGQQSSWLVLVNHDAGSWHFLESPRGFLRHTGVVYLVPWWVFFILLGVGLVAYCLYWGRPPFPGPPVDPPIAALWTVSLWPWLGLCLAPALAVGVFVGWQSLRVRHLWKQVEGVVPKMVNTLLGKTGSIDWPAPKEVDVSAKA